MWASICVAYLSPINNYFPTNRAAASMNVRRHGGLITYSSSRTVGATDGAVTAIISTPSLTIIAAVALCGRKTYGACVVVPKNGTHDQSDAERRTNLPDPAA